MHHRPSGPSATARIRAAAVRFRWHVQQSGRRIVLALTVTAAVTLALLTLPVVSGTVEAGAPGAPPVTVDATSSRTTAAPVPASPSGVPGAPSAPSLPSAPAVNGPRTTTPAAEGSSGTGPGPSSASSSTGRPATTTRPTTTTAPASPTGSGHVAASSGSPAPTDRTPAPVVPQIPATGPSVAAGSASSAAPPDADAATRVLGLVNAARQAAGCGPVTGDAELDFLAGAHSDAMRDRGALTAVDAAGAGSPAVLAHGPQDAAPLVASWLDAPELQAVLLDCGSERLGVGASEGSDGTWWTALLR